ncbi:amidohydrolase family protein [Bacillus sp. UNC438CL73TsuS30]|uniref:amidohydrolase family protein n=1 Tax=Bacillus sp. UNC438CL73TsuS30 TaxID=1340434 RepID=UPI00047C2D61|nr:amidohydrolase family protein [Bacillus sp. UNC438CL73TsuS30]
MRIDAHQHYWQIDRNDYGWLKPDNTVLYRDYFPEQLESSLKRHRIDQTILVQAAPTIEETEFLFGLSNGTDSIAGVVGWLDLSSPKWMEHLTRFQTHPKFVGIRIMIQDMEDESVVLQAPYLRALSILQEEDLPVDLLVRSHQLPVLNELLGKVPKLRGVVDHMGKPPIAAGQLEPWKSQMREIANQPNIYCKLSGMVTEADPISWKKEDFMFYVNHIIDIFGYDRIMYGSDWPVCLSVANYDEVYQSLFEILPASCSEEDLAKVFGLNAKRFYNI